MNNKLNFKEVEEIILSGGYLTSKQAAAYLGVTVKSLADYKNERSIRLLISQRLKELGDQWWEDKIPENIKVEAEKRHKKEVSSGTTPRSYELLDYTDFGELGVIIIANWDIFGDMFRDKDAVRAVMSRLNMLRGPIAHCGYLREDEVVRLHMTLGDWFRLMS
ncbi:MAG: hypothetical protein COV35_03355 [Alphaproteobacteria bacterium CG11_big_fil_rev_8_21_14_0_20_39_49]|nr:MAG: hypothetical protein COV35_03355 [Alphaproteobacteria bacterium CG11_big_fil_rev_8_21_14_0_20_39_49]